MTTIMFQHRFADRVGGGTKLQTIRPPRKRLIVAGERLSLRKWADKAYRSPQIVLREASCISCEPVWIGYDTHAGNSIFMRTRYLTAIESERFAKADGFESFQEMFEWFSQTHGMSFHGILIRWEK